MPPGNRRPGDWSRWDDGRPVLALVMERSEGAGDAAREPLDLTEEATEAAGEEVRIKDPPADDEDARAFPVAALRPRE